MPESIRPLHLCAVLLALAICLLTDARAAAIVADVRGAARLADGAAVELLVQLPPGAEVRLAPGAEIVLIHLGAHSTYTLGGPGAYVVRPGDVQALGAGRIVQGKALPAAFQGVRLQAARTAQASIAMRGTAAEVSLRLISPVATWLLERAVELRWEHPAEPAAEFSVQLTDEENRVVFETRTQGTAVLLPAEVVLEPGKLYGWQVRAQLANGRTAEGWSEFGLADGALLARADAARPGPDAPYAERIAYALLLEALNLRASAQAAWADAARARPGDARVRALAERR
jgi:hypothetical protein